MGKDGAIEISNDFEDEEEEDEGDAWGDDWGAPKKEDFSKFDY
jgi:hypothetical protein